MIKIKDNKMCLDKDTKFEGIDEFVIIDRKNNEIYCAYKCVTESSTDKGYIVVFCNGNVGYEIYGQDTTMGEAFNYDKFYVCSVCNIEINADALVTY